MPAPAFKVKVLPALPGTQTAAAAASAAAAATSATLAATRATAAETSRTAAAASESAASVSATNSASSATAAAASAGAAAAASRLYATTAAGITATTNGQYFYVPQSAPNESILDLYKNNSGSAVYINSAPSKAALDAVTGTLGAVVPVGYGFALPDPRGSVAFGVTTDGITKAGAVELETINGVPAFTALDEATWLPSFSADITMVMSYGQSLGRGGVLASGGPLSTITRFNDLQFNGLLRYSYASEPTSLIALTEFELETPVSGTVEGVWERVEAEHSLPRTAYAHQFLGTAPAINGVDIAQLTKAGTAPSNYANMMDDVGDAKVLANAAGKTLHVGSVLWTHGSGDYGLGTSKATYKAALSGLVSDIGTDIAVITGQSDDVAVLCAQSSDHIYSGGAGTEPYIGLAQFELSQEIDNFYIACPIYPFPKVSSDNVHLTNVGSKWMGGYYGIAHKRIVLDGDEWAPLYCVESYAQGSIIFLRFNVPCGRLVFDTSQVAAQTNMGFSALNSSLAALTVSSVTITGPDTVRVVTSASAAGGRIRYGFGADGGNLRDSQGDVMPRFNVGGINKRMDNWCLIFERAL